MAAHRNHGGAPDQWWNPAAWTLDNYQLGTLGNSGVGSCQGPGLANTDFSIYKNFKPTERVTMQFRFEFFNLFNRVNFANPISNLNAVQSTSIDPNSGRIIGSSGDFGRIVSTSNNPRLIQFAIKLNF